MRPMCMEKPHVSDGGTPGSTVLCELTRGFQPVLFPSCVAEDSRSGEGFQVCLGIQDGYGEYTSVIVPIRSGVSLGPLLFLLFVNNPTDAIEELTLILAENVKMATRQVRKITLRRSRFTKFFYWLEEQDLFINPAKCNYFTIGREVSQSFFPGESGTPVFVPDLVKDKEFLPLPNVLTLWIKHGDWSSW